MIAGVTVTGVLLHLTATSFYRNAAVRWCVDWVWDHAVYKAPTGDPKECIDALKTRLAAIEKLTWFFLTLIATGYIASMSSAPTVKLAGLDIPTKLFARAYFLAFTACILYYAKLLGSVDRICKIAPNKADVQLHVAVGSGFLSPFSESSSLTGWILDISGFCLLISAWWAAFVVGIRLLKLDSGRIGHWLPWVAVIVGMLALFLVKETMTSIAQSRVLLITKLIVACVSIPCLLFLAIHLE